MNKLIFGAFFILIMHFGTSCVQKTIPAEEISIQSPTAISTYSSGAVRSKAVPNGNKLLVSDMMQKKLFIHDPVTSEKVEVASSKINMDDVHFTANGRFMYYVKSDFSTKRRLSSLVVYDLSSSETTIAIDKVRELKILNNAGKDNVIYFLKGNEVQSYNPVDQKNDSAPDNFSATLIDKDLNLVLWKDGKKEVLNPMGEARYLWSSISPDQTQLLFSIVGKDAYILNLEDKSTIKLGKLHAPNWSPDGNWVIGMDDKDDGETFTKSDVILASPDGKVRKNLTIEEDVIALYPSFSSDGSQIIFNDNSGTIYTTDVNKK